MTTKPPRKPRAKKTTAPRTEGTPTVAPAGEAFEQLLNATVKEKAEHEEYIAQTHLQRIAWALFGQLVDRGIVRLPDFDHVDDKAVLAEAEWLHATICELVLSLQAIDPTGDTF